MINKSQFFPKSFPLNCPNLGGRSSPKNVISGFTYPTSVFWMDSWKDSWSLEELIAHSCSSHFTFLGMVLSPFSFMLCAISQMWQIGTWSSIILLENHSWEYSWLQWVQWQDAYEPWASTIRFGSIPVSLSKVSMFWVYTLLYKIKSLKNNYIKPGKKALFL